MKVLTGIRATGQQILTTTASNGDTINIVLYFQSRSNSWKMDVSCNDFEVKGLRVSHVLNMLCQYNNIIPFGISVIIDDGGEPFLINDFSSERVQLTILTPDEVNNIAAFYVGLKDAG